MIQIRDLSIAYGKGTPLENNVFKDFNLSIPEHQFVTVIGSNGAGKSTLLSAIAGEAEVQSGSILLDNKNITNLPIHKRSHYLARVFQDPLTGTCENLTIEENLALANARTRSRTLSSFRKTNRRSVFVKKLKSLQLGLENRLDDKIGLLSGGQRQAISLLMASLQPMKLLLLDEHTAALDPKTAKFILALTEEIINTEKLTALMVTHSMSHALSVGDRTIMLHQGKIALDVADEQRARMDAQELISQFHYHDIDSDALLLSN